MKISIRHLGKIERASLDIRPITLLVGENNTNKTWTAYSIYALLKSLSRDSGPTGNVARVATRAFAQQIQALASQPADRIVNAPPSASVNLEFSRETMLKSMSKEVRLALRGVELAKVLAAPRLKGRDVRGAAEQIASTLGAVRPIIRAEVARDFPQDQDLRALIVRSGSAPNTQAAVQERFFRDTGVRLQVARETANLRAFIGPRETPHPK